MRQGYLMGGESKVALCKLGQKTEGRMSRSKKTIKALCDRQSFCFLFL